MNVETLGSVTKLRRKTMKEERNWEKEPPAQTDCYLDWDEVHTRDTVGEERSP